MSAAARNFNPIVEVFDPYSTPFTNQLESQQSDSSYNQQQANYESSSSAMPCACTACTACSACGGCACACSACM